MTVPTVLCLFCQQPARVDLGDRLALIVANLEAIWEDPTLNTGIAHHAAERALLFAGGIKTEPGYAERFRIWAKRPRIVAHPGCAADWAHDETRESDEDGGSDGSGILYEAVIEDARQETADRANQMHADEGDTG